MPKFAKNDLPQRYEITPLVKHYLENIHALYPILSESKLFQSIDAVYQENGHRALPIDHWTVRLVIATSTASLSRKRGDTSYQDAVRHAAAALEEIETVVHPGSIVGIQAILQLVLYSMLDPHHFNSWYLIGLASRVMVDIGLHQDPPEELRLDRAELDMRLRVYECVYALDRSVTLFLEYSCDFFFRLCMCRILGYPFNLSRQFLGTSTLRKSSVLFMARSYLHYSRWVLHGNLRR